MNTLIKNRLNKSNFPEYSKDLPIKIIQIGGGNFMRAFVDYTIEKINQNSDFKGGIVQVKATANGSNDSFDEQNGLFTVFIRGIKKGETIDEKQVVSAIQKIINPYEDYNSFLELAKIETLEFIFSNTTESGIVFDDSENSLDNTPHHNFPAKMTALLYARFLHFNGDAEKGLTFLPCELIGENAQTLKSYILKYAELWKLEDEFISWIENHNYFHNTLVDRIVPGYPKDDVEAYATQLNYEDDFMVVSEAFLLWAIEADKKLIDKIPFDKAEEQILLVDDLQPYRTTKVRILNGSHTVMVPFSLLYGLETVKEAIDDEFCGKFIRNSVYNEIIPALDFSQEELISYAEDTFDRFRNPFVKHFLSSIALNSISKFKVRVLPSLLEYQSKFGKLPKNLTFSMACLLRFYKGEWNGITLPVKDDKIVVDKFNNIWKEDDYTKIAELTLQDIQFWDQDLTKVPELKSAIADALELMDKKGIKEAYNLFVN